MIQLTPTTKIMVAIEAIDFRAGIDSLSAICRDRFQQDPFSGVIYLFRNRAGTAIKLLAFDGTGFWLLHKRFSEGKLCWWPKKSSEPITPLAAKQLQILIYNGDPTTTQFAEDWRKLSL